MNFELINLSWTFLQAFLNPLKCSKFGYNSYMLEALNSFKYSHFHRGRPDSYPQRCFHHPSLRSGVTVGTLVLNLPAFM